MSARYFLVLGWVISVLTMAVVTTWLRISIVNQTYKFNTLSHQIKNSMRRVQQLDVSVAQLRSPKRLEDIAKARRDLSTPKKGQVVYLGGALSR